MTEKQYIIGGGEAELERLRIIASILRPSTLDVLKRAGLKPGMRCLDVGCGFGEVTFDIADAVGPGGHATGVDIEAKRLDSATERACREGRTNVAFQTADITQPLLAQLPQDGDASGLDLIYVRFVLTHLKDPAGALANLKAALKPGGVLIVEDVDMSVRVCYPPSVPYDRFFELYDTAVLKRDADPQIGPKLPFMFRDAGFSDPAVSIVQRADYQGEVKLIVPLSLEGIADVIIGDGIATAEEMQQLAVDLHAAAADPDILFGTPQVFQVWDTST